MDYSVTVSGREMHRSSFRILFCWRRPSVIWQNFVEMFFFANQCFKYFVSIIRILKSYFTSFFFSVIVMSSFFGSSMGLPSKSNFRL